MRRRATCSRATSVDKAYLQAFPRYVDFPIRGAPVCRLTTVPAGAQLPAALAPAPKDEFGYLGPREEPERNEGRSRSRGNMQSAGWRGVEAGNQPSSRVRECHASPRDWNADLAGVEVASEDQVE